MASIDGLTNIACTKIISPQFRVTQPINLHVGPLPLTSGSFTSGGGILLIFASGSAFAGSSQIIGMSVAVDSTIVGGCNIRINVATSNEHLPFVSNAIIATGISAGLHTITLTGTGAGFQSDNTDYYSATVLELPF